jgi:hypothetical protein
MRIRRIKFEKNFKLEYHYRKLDNRLIAELTSCLEIIILVKVRKILN